MTNTPAIVGASCVFPAGPSLPLADAALQTQLALPGRHPCYVDRCGFRVKISYFPNTAFGFDAARWCSLARTALDELADSLAANGVADRMPARLLLVLPRTARGGVPQDLADALFASVQYERFAWEEIKTIRGGHAVGVHAVMQAADVSRQEDRLTVVLAVDSWLHPDALRPLEDGKLLHGAHAREGREPRPNPYGRMPGEGAAAVAFEPRAARRAGPKTRPWALLSGAALAKEARPSGSREPCTGLGLTQAAREALSAARASASLVGHVCTDMNGEPYRADEYGFTTLQLGDALAPGWKRTAPTLVSGDLGTASAIARLAMATYRMHHRPAGHSPQHLPSRQLILCSSDDTLRAAMVLDAPPHPAARERTTT